ncbi:MAG: type II toxin-antitoxin system HicA family toxin [Thaumarchaeota archaeon]|nr:type II toxin-antitoxin system HicA family toxin [Nitrososphaerota archaeon]
MSNKLPVVTHREMIKYLQRKGFSMHEGKKHTICYKGNRKTMVPRHGNKELRPGTLKTILEQADIPVDEFKRDLRRGS